MDAPRERRRGRPSRGRVRPPRERRVGDGRALPGRDASTRACRARSSSASATRARSTRCGPGAGVEHRVIPWDEVSVEEGTGIVHIAPGCGAEDFELVARPRPRRSSRRSTSPAASTTSTAGSTAHRPGTPPTRSSATSPSAACSSTRALSSTATRTAGAATRRSSSGSPTTGSSRSRRFAGRSSTRTPPSSGRPRTWASAWTTGSGTWATGTSRGAATTGCPCRSTRARCGHLTVIGSKAELLERATGPLEGLEELRRPWVDAIRIRCESCGEEVERIAEVGDVWLDAGIVPFSTLGWESPEYVPEGYATGAAKRPDHAPTCPTTRTGRSGSPPTGSPRCASRSGCGSTRSSSCRSR